MKRSSVLIGILVVLPLAAAAQPAHQHAMPVNAVGGGLPPFCSQPTAVALADGPWSAPSTWSSNAVPAAAARVLVPAGRQVTYDAVSTDTVLCIEVRGRLAFATDRSTKLKIVNLLVMENGLLEVGTAERPIAASSRAEIVIADQPIRSAARSRPGRQRDRGPGPDRHARQPEVPHLRAGQESRARRRNHGEPRAAGRRLDCLATGSSFPIRASFATRSAAARSGRETKRGRSSPCRAIRSRCRRRSRTTISAPAKSRASAGCCLTSAT